MPDANLLRLCFVCSEYPPVLHGGLGRSIQIFARVLVAAGHQVRVIGLYSPQYDGPELELDQGVEVFRLRLPRVDQASIRARALLLSRIRAWIRAGEIDLVEFPDGGGWSAWWPKVGVPVVVRCNGSTSYFARELGHRVRRSTFWFERAGMRRADYWYSASKFTAEKTQSLFGLPPADAVIYNIALEDSIATLSANGKGTRSRNKVVFTGTLTLKKGILSLIRAWPKVRRESRGAELHIYGKDISQPWPMTERLLREVPDEERDSVFFHGHVASQPVREVLQEARLAVFPSYCEAFSLAPMEAMVQGCPTIVGRRSSGPELITHGVNGLLVDPADCDEIAASILSLLRDDERAARLGEAGRRTILERFTAEKILPETIAFYKQCIAGFRNGQVRGH